MTGHRDDIIRLSGLTASSPLKALLTTSGYRGWVALVAVVQLVAAVAQAISPLVQKRLIDSATAGLRSVTLWCAAVWAFLTMLTMLSRTGNYLLRFRLGVEARCRLKSALFHCMLGLPESFLKERGSGYFFNRLQADSTEVVSFFSGSALSQLGDLLSCVMVLGMTLHVNWKCACLALPLLLFQCLVYRKYRKKQYHLGHELQECVASERYRMQEYLAGHATIKTHGAAENVTESLEKGLGHWRKLAYQRLSHENHFRFLIMTPYYLCCGCIALYGLEQVLQRRWTLGALWALLVLVRQLFEPVQRLALARFQMQQASAAWERLRQLCRIDNGDCPEAVEGTALSEGAAMTCSLEGDIVFSGISFAYKNAEALFSDLTFTVKSKELFFLTGRNGSGKSTLFQLLLRLYQPTAGTITIGGRSIEEFPLASYRSRIGYLGQTPEFFPGTIRENLLMGETARTHSDQDILEALRLIQSEEVVSRRPAGLDSAVTERGENFSGGERLRLALARELLRDTDILLLDEPAASLDAETRRGFYDMLRKLQGRHTMIVITHDEVDSSRSFSLS